MNRTIHKSALVFFLWSAVLPRVFPGEPSLSLGLLWTGSWEHGFLKKGGWNSGGNLANRGELELGLLLPRKRGPSSPVLSARFLTLDKRPLMPWEHPDEGNTVLGCGLYHNPTGSRFLYGILNEHGLPARLHNPGGKSAPFAENRRSSGADLKSEPSSVRDAEAYLYLASPRWWIIPGKTGLAGFVFSQLDNALDPAAGAGVDLQAGKKTNFGLETFFTGKRLSPKAVSTWFSETPPLPERNFAIYGLNLYFNSPLIGFSADGAYSETFAFGRDLYAAGAFRLGSRPWRLSLAADGAGSRFTDRSGTNRSAAFRTALRFDWKDKQNSLLRTTVTLRSGGLGKPFDRSSLALSYRFPWASKIAAEKNIMRAFLRPANVSFEAGRNAAGTAKVLDKLELGLGFTMGPVKTAFSAALTGSAKGDWAEDEKPFPVPGAASAYEFYSAKVSTGASYYPGPFQFKVNTGCAFTMKDPVWDISLSGAVRLKYGRIGVKIASSALPGTWQYTLFWRLEAFRELTRAIDPEKKNSYGR